MTKNKHEPNGINWLLVDTWTKVQAAQRLAASTKVAGERRCMLAEDPEEDPVRKAWEERMNKPPEQDPNTPSVTGPKPVPSFSDIVRQHEKAGA